MVVDFQSLLASRAHRRADERDRSFATKAEATLGRTTLPVRSSSSTRADTVLAVATQTIYVELLDEGVDVWRPVEATVEADGTFRLPDQAPMDEAWRFPPGSFVRCQQKLLSDGEALVASELVG